MRHSLTEKMRRGEKTRTLLTGSLLTSGLMLGAVLLVVAVAGYMLLR